MSSEHQPISFNQGGRAYGVFEDGTTDPLRSAKNAHELMQRVIVGDPDAEDAYEGVRYTFATQDTEAMPDGAMWHRLRNLGPVMWLSGRYHDNDQRSMDTFAGFMAERHNSFAEAIRRDTPYIIDGLAARFGHLEPIYQGAELRRAAVAEVYRRLGITAINSFEAGAGSYDGICQLDEGSAIMIGIANKYADSVHHDGIDVGFWRVLAHEGAHAAGAEVRGGFVYGIADDNPGLLIEEVGAEISARMAAYGARDLEDAVLIGEGVYKDELDLFWTLARYGESDLTAELLLEAHGTPRDAAEPSSPRRYLLTQLDKSIASLVPAYAEGGVRQLCAEYAGRRPYRRPVFVREILKAMVKEKVMYEDEIEDALSNAKVVMVAASPIHDET